MTDSGGLARRAWTAERLLREIPRLAVDQEESIDPFTEDWFFESMIADVWLCATERVAAVLIDLRTAECFDEENVAVLVMHSPRDIRWTLNPATREHRRDQVPRWLWPMSLSSRFNVDGDVVTADLGGALDGDSLVISAERAYLYAGTITGLGAIPDMQFDDDAEIRRRLPTWSDEIDVIGHWVLPEPVTKTPLSRAGYLRVVDEG